MYIRKILLFIIVCILCFSTTLYAVDYRIEDYRIEANVNSDGSMSVVEYLKYYFDSSMNGLYRDIMYKYQFSSQDNGMEPTSSRYQASGISDINVYTSDVSFDNMRKSYMEPENILSNGMRDVYSVSDIVNNGYRKKIKVYSPVSSGNSKYVRYEYVIEDVAVNYNDQAEVYWNFVGADWECYIDNLNIKVNVEGVDEIKAFGHTYANVNEFNIIGNTVNMVVTNIKSGTAVDIRAVFPNTYMGTLSKNISQNYDFNKLNEIEEKAVIGKQKYNIYTKIWPYYIAIYIVTIIYLIYRAIKCANKNVKTYGKVEHYTDIPSEHSLGDYNCIRNRMFGYSDPNLIVASILDLSCRKYILLESLKKAKFFKDTYVYNISVNPEKNLNDLNDYEKELLNYIFNKKSDASINASDFVDNKFELNERFKELGLDYKLGAKYRKSMAAKTSANEKSMYNPVPKNLWKTYGYSFLILIIIAMINIFGISPLTDKYLAFVPVIFVSIMVFGILALIIESVAKTLKDEYVDSYNKLLGLQKYLKEYSLIKDRYPIELVLWEKYLVFASLFGIADKVAKEFKEELLKQGHDENYIYTTYPMMHIAMHSHSFTASAASMSGTSSSGGYSGGGSGGGGRRWRWRRSILTV